MKKLFITLFIVLTALFAVAQAYYKTPSNIAYYKIGSGPDVVIYMDGFSSNPNPLGSSFYKSFLPSIKDKVTCYIPFPFPNAGWEKPWNGTNTGCDFLNFVASQHKTERIFVTGYSAGGDPGYIFGANRVTAFASVAGSDRNWKSIQWWVNEKKVPVFAIWGENDTSENNTSNCKYTWLDCFKTFGGNLTYKIVPGNHGVIDDYAYNPANGLWEWFDSIGKQPDPINPVTKIPVKNAYFILPDKKLEVELENGEVLRFTPD